MTGPEIKYSSFRFTQPTLKKGPTLKKIHDLEFFFFFTKIYTSEEFSKLNWIKTVWTFSGYDISRRTPYQQNDLSEDQIRRVFDDNWRIIFVSSP